MARGAATGTKFAAHYTNFVIKFNSHIDPAAVAIALTVGIYMAIYGFALLRSGKARILEMPIRKSDHPVLFWYKVIASFLISLAGLFGFFFELFRQTSN
jgi:uncharacterized membrane protein